MEYITFSLCPWADKASIKIYPIDDYYRVCYESAFGGGSRNFETATLAERFANGEKVMYKTPTNGRKITVGGKKREAQFEKWTERCSGSEVLETEMVVYHFGFKGKSLAEVETCFFASWPKTKNYVYSGSLVVTIPVGTEVYWYGSEEIRCIPNQNFVVKHLTTGWLSDCE